MKIVNTSEAPEAIGPYSQAIEVNSFLYCSGQIPLNPNTMKIESEDVVGQTNQVFKNLVSVLNSNGYSLENVVKSEVFLKNIDDFQKVNEVYSKWMNGHKPARQAVGNLHLPKGALVEISLIAYKNNG